MARVRSVFISDVHLGTRACQADQLLSFLRDHPSEHLFLIGDIIDFWSMNRSIHWSPMQNTAVQKVLRRARHGCKVIFIPGNHDEVLREYAGIAFGDIRVESDWVHTAADGRRYWLVHGDEFDQVTRHHRWVALLGDIGYNTLVRINHLLSRMRRLLGRPGYWSLAGYAKQKVKKAVSFVFDFESSIAHATRAKGLDAVICGHIHWAADRDIDAVRYLNCGDWVDSCTGLVEHYDGRIEIVRWDSRHASAEVFDEEDEGVAAAPAERGIAVLHAPMKIDPSGVTPPLSHAFPATETSFHNYPPLTSTSDEHSRALDRNAPANSERMESACNSAGCRTS